MRRTERRTERRTGRRPEDRRIEIKKRRRPYWLESDLSEKEREIVGDVMFRRALQENGLPVPSSVWVEL